MKVKSTIKQHSLLFYFVFAYVITWSGIVLVVAGKGFDPRAIELNDGLLIFLAMILGPSLSSILLTTLLDGKNGVRILFGGMARWHVGWRGYARLLIVPALAVPILLVLSVTVSPIYQPNLNLAFALIVGTLAGFCEELGWTGFALPRLQARYSVFASGLILGVLWAFWHILADYWGNVANYGAYWLPHFVVYWMLPLTAYRILMAHAYKETNSLLLGQLMHMFYTGTLALVEPPMSPTNSMLWQGIFAVSLWVVVAVVFLRKKKWLRAVK